MENSSRLRLLRDRYADLQAMLQSVNDALGEMGLDTSADLLQK